jgi:hypothetical protein
MNDVRCLDFEELELVFGEINYQNIHLLNNITITSPKCFNQQVVILM